MAKLTSKKQKKNDEAIDLNRSNSLIITLYIAQIIKKYL